MSYQDALCQKCTYYIYSRKEGQLLEVTLCYQMNNENKPSSIIFIDAIDGYNNGFDVEELKSILRGYGFV